MMELRIKITRKNAEKVVQLIRELAQLEEGAVLTGIKAETATPHLAKTLPDYLAPPPHLENLESGIPHLEKVEAKRIGTWGQFNSFFPVKAVLRVLCHMVSENGEKSVNLQELVNKSKTIFELAGLGHYRGFPSSRKESAIGRLVWHFITPAHEMGLIRIEGAEEIPVRGWGRVSISPTKEGYEFAKLKNLIFDEHNNRQVLSDIEREWMLSHLKKIDSEGYKEYSFLREVFEELKNGNTDIASWLRTNKQFINYVKSWSRKAKNEKKFEKQVVNVAAMFAQSKIALLRELGAINNKRGDYTVVGDIEVEEVKS